MTPTNNYATMWGVGNLPRCMAQECMAGTQCSPWPLSTLGYPPSNILFLVLFVSYPGYDKDPVGVQVADVPLMHTTKLVQSLQELEDSGLARLKTMMKNSQPLDAAIDVSLLARVLIAQELSIDSDMYWDEEMLLTEVASDLQKAREERERFSSELAV